MLQKPDPITPWWAKQAEQAEALLRQHMRAHNVARLNRCTGQFLKPIGLAFRFVDASAEAKPQMRLCRQMGREFQPLDHGPCIEDDGLHDDERVSAAIWRALEIAKAER